MFDSKSCWGPFLAPGCPQDLYQLSLAWRLKQAGGCSCPASRADGIQDPRAALLLPETGGLLPQLLQSCQWFSCAESSLSSLFSFWYRHPNPLFWEESSQLFYLAHCLSMGVFGLHLQLWYLAYYEALPCCGQL